ncbi:archaellin/type IV pilin N-terminal domain-containing protein [Candidatus Nanosalina sp. VS9-1]|uniref:archaellin/type IV pilin N-terminal domain-containing protein n=1 Tax=Candidatus Nanosalina sp. VS9-1 TaxID=3388566 RepID=UPI0039DFA2CA
MNRKGVTPLVGTALLILIAVSAVTSAAVFIRDTTQQVSDSVNERISEDEMRENSGIDIEYAYNNSDGNISLVVRNTGRYTLTVEENNNKFWNLYSDGRPVGFTYSDGSGGQKLIDPDATLTLQTQIEFPQGDYTSVNLEGTYGTSSSIICDESDPDGAC